jgi:hypothetical protein
MGDAQLDALSRSTLATDALAHALELLGQGLIRGDYFVEGVRDLSFDASDIDGKPHRKITNPHSLESA